MKDSELRIGVVGTGAIAQIVHLPVVTELPGARIAAVCDRDYAKARAIAARMDVKRVFQEDEEMFSSDEVDAVIICSPSHLHERQAVAALQAGKHVLVERPLALTPAGAESAAKAAEKAGRVLMVADCIYRGDRYQLSAADLQGRQALAVATGDARPHTGQRLDDPLHRPPPQRRVAIEHAGKRASS